MSSPTYHALFAKVYCDRDVLRVSVRIDLNELFRQLPGTMEKEEQTAINPLGASSRVLVVGASRYCVCSYALV